MSIRIIRHMAIGMLASAVVLSVSACGSGAGKTRSYGQDGYNGVQNSFPNLQVGTNNEGNHGYDEDSAFMSRVVKEVQGVKSANLFLSGASVLVRIQVDPGLTEEQMESVRKQVQQQLEYQIPRYRYHVDAGK